ncbi:MAG: cytidine deaminase [Eubacteriales bacterium]|nr:cytidine deaminase [Eubacteriales bacterium]
MDKNMEQKLIARAFEAQKRAYVPYSGFSVGAALLAKDGKVYLGCNIENATYTPTNCAERTAFFKAVSEGVTEFEAIAIVGGKKDASREEGKLCPPCGVCRQVMQEFCDAETFQVILAVSEENYRVFTLKELLPLGFGPEHLQ